MEQTDAIRVRLGVILQKVPMKKVEDCRQHAAECRRMANRSRSPEEKSMFTNIADSWESLAVDRAASLARRGRLPALDAKPLSIDPIDRRSAKDD